MKVSKDAKASAKRMFRLCTKDGHLNEDHLRTVFKAIAEKKPRNYLAILFSLKNLVRLELIKNTVTVESAEPLDAVASAKVKADIIAQHGNGLTFEYKVNPELLGGIRIRKADDVWDGSVRSRLERLAEAF